MTDGVTFYLEHSTSGVTWTFSRWLPQEEKEAKLELLRMRSLAEGSGTKVQYRARRRTVEDLPW